MLAAARELFVDQGYAATTVEQIAAAAGVAVQTVYYTFRTKGSLLREVVDATAAGGDQASATMERAWARDMLSANTAQRVVALAVEHGTAIYERVATLWPAVTAAGAADPDVATYWSSVSVARRDGQRRMVTRIVEVESLRPGLDSERATDLVVALLGHDIYRTLVIEAGWSLPTFRAWLFTTVVQQLLGPVDLDAEATADLSYGGYLGGSDRA